MYILQKLKKCIQDNQNVDKFIKENTPVLFQHDHIKKAYQLLRETTLHDMDNNVTLAWLALFSGDNMKMAMIVESIKEDDLSLPYQAFYYDIQALSSALLSIEERLAYNEKAIHLLDTIESHFILANAYLTRGQLYSGCERFRDAAASFMKAYKLFLAHQIEFPAIVSLVNALINKTRLGEFEAVHQEVQHAMLLSNTTTKPCWDIISLPLGMVLTHEGKHALALEHLKRAYKTINELELLHLHGFVELYLIQVSTIMKQHKLAKKYMKEADDLFNKRHYPMMKAIVIYGKVLTKEPISSADIQLIELAYQKETTSRNPLMFELVAYFFIQNKTSCITVADLIQQIDHYRYTGDLLYLAQTILFLAEYHYKNKNNNDAKIMVKEYLAMYHNLDIKAPLYSYSYSFWDIIRTLDKTIDLPRKEVDELTPKEHEILEHVAKGLSNKEIAETLYITVGTVKWHLNHVYSKLQVKSRLEAVQKAQQLQFL